MNPEIDNWPVIQIAVNDVKLWLFLSVTSSGSFEVVDAS